MVKPREDLTGQIFGRWTVIKQVEDRIQPSGKHIAQWLCKCSCGNPNTCIKKITGGDLKSGKTMSCGCFARENMSQIKSRPMCEDKSLRLNLQDEYGLYGMCLTSNTRVPFYFDMEDYGLIKNYCWHEYVDNKMYHDVRTTDKDTGKMIKMHWLFGCKGYDHEDINPLNNRRYNLRPATVTENARNHSRQKNNTSGITGVSWNLREKKWKSYITVNKKRIWLGAFTNKEDAIRTRLEAEQKYFKKFAPQKYLFKEYNITIQN